MQRKTQRARARYIAQFPAYDLGKIPARGRLIQGIKNKTARAQVAKRVAAIPEAV